MEYAPGSDRLCAPYGSMTAMASSPTVQRRDLGGRLRRYRIGAGLTGEQAGVAVEQSGPWISHLEKGNVGIKRGKLLALLDVYGVTDEAERQALVDLAVGGRQRGWWSRYRSDLSSTYSSYIGFEDGAGQLRVWESLVVHGLLQTREYAMLVTRASAPGDSDEAIARKVEVRLARQRRLLGDHPLRLLVVLDEAVLHRVFAGDVAVHRAQLEHLIAVAADTATYPNVRVQVLPFSHSAFPGQLASFTILEGFPDDQRDIVYIETRTGDLYEEPPESQEYKLTHDDLRATALGEATSIELMRTVLAGLAPSRGSHQRAYATGQDEVGEEHP